MNNQVTLTEIFSVCFNPIMDTNTANRIIDALGGTNAVAELCEVTAQAVSQWRTDGIPKSRMMFIKVVRSKVIKETLQKLADEETHHGE